MAVACPRRIGEVDGCLVPTTALFGGGIFGLKYFPVSIGLIFYDFAGTIRF